ncbi:hypothetical protein DERP_013556 [Dermatophagoides pteronyssinus]|uniref:Uncharacterized protein n=1 Tax=Dermatophagoides pteronyssinus TaxID=6956 RepID=A0ABQ8J5F6_DERPT|nr:hypothetical protein DERP_013556 [Dermatophagoides pteronyssinus]
MFRYLYAEMFVTAAYLLNRWKKADGKSPFEKLFLKDQNIDHLRTIGYRRSSNESENIEPTSSSSISGRGNTQEAGLIVRDEHRPGNINQELEPKNRKTEYAINENAGKQLVDRVGSMFKTHDVSNVNDCIGLKIKDHGLHYVVSQVSSIGKLLADYGITKADRTKPRIFDHIDDNYETIRKKILLENQLVSIVWKYKYSLCCQLTIMIKNILDTGQRQTPIDIDISIVEMNSELNDLKRTKCLKLFIQN